LYGLKVKNAKAEAHEGRAVGREELRYVRDFGKVIVNAEHCRREGECGSSDCGIVLDADQSKLFDSVEEGKAKGFLN